MGFIYKLSSIKRDNIDKLMTPIVFCIGEDEIDLYTKEYNILSINGLLSKNLLKYGTDKRSLFVTDEFNKIINNICEPILLKNFEMLFDPDFQIDVLRLFIIANRKKRIAVLWCGKYKDGKLIFAEPEYQDYKSYDIKDYNIDCII